MELLLPLLLAAVVTVALIPLLERRAKSLRVMDSPGERKIHDHPVPRIGGIAMAGGAAMAFLVWLPIDRQALAYLLGALIVLIFGVWDDRRTLGPWTKLLGQLVGVAVVVLVGDVTIHSVTLESHIELPRSVAIPLTILFLVGVTNAINLSDGLDGLAGGTTLLCFVAIAVMAVGHDAPLVNVVTFVMIGSLIGFLRYNSYPARVFMGDGGSQLLGFTAGVISILLTQDPLLPYSAALPLLLLGLPIIDTLTVMARRISQRRSPFAADKGHIHHRLMARGLDHFEAVAAIYMLQAILFVAAWLMRYQSDAQIVGVLAAFWVALMAALLLGRMLSLRWRGVRGTQLGQIVAQRLPRLKAPEFLPRWGNLIAWACMLTYFLGVALTSTTISEDVAWLALGMAMLLLVAASGLAPLDIVGRLAHGATFVTAVAMVYIDHTEVGEPAAFDLAKWVLFPVLGTAVVLRLRFWRERRFELTPLDVVVVFLALVLPNLPGLQESPSNLGISVAKLILLLYAIEMLVVHSDRVRRWTWFGCAVALTLVAVQGLVVTRGVF